MRSSLFRRLPVLVFLLVNGLSVAQDSEFVFYSNLANDWYVGGDYFEWTSTTEDNNAAKVNVFYRTWGDETKPKLVLIHLPPAVAIPACTGPTGRAGWR